MYKSIITKYKDNFFLTNLRVVTQIFQFASWASKISIKKKISLEQGPKEKSYINSALVRDSETIPLWHPYPHLPKENATLK